MHLLVVSQYFWPENFRINDLVAALTERGHQVTVLTGYPNYPDGVIYADFQERPKDFELFNGSKIVRVPLFPRGRGRFSLVSNYISFMITASVIGVWKLRGRRFDAILVYEPSPITVGVPAIVLRSAKKAPLAFWVLDLWPETLEALGVIKSKLILALIGKLVACIYKRCDLILAQSRSFIDHIANYCANQQRIVYFPNWAESLFTSNSVSAAQEVPPAQGKFTVMFAGNIGESQDFPAILRAVEKIKEYNHLVRWIILGDGRMATWVKKEVIERGLQDVVLMLGRHPVERMPDFFMHADVLLISLQDKPIFSMTIPGKLQSYLAAGIPVVAMLNGEGADMPNPYTE